MLKGIFFDTRVFKKHRNAVYQCLKKPPTFFRHASVFKTRMVASPAQHAAIFDEIKNSHIIGSRRKKNTCQGVTFGRVGRDPLKLPREEYFGSMCCVAGWPASAPTPTGHESQKNNCKTLQKTQRRTALPPQTKYYENLPAISCATA